RLSERLHLLVKRPHDGELQPEQPDHLVERATLAPIHALGELVREERYLGPQRNVALVQKAPRTDHDIAHRLVSLVGPDYLDLALPSRHGHSGEGGPPAGGGQYVRPQFGADGLGIRPPSIIRFGRPRPRPWSRFGGGDFWTGPLHLLEDVITTGERDG